MDRPAGSGPLNNDFYDNKSVVYSSKKQDFTTSRLDVKIIDFNGTDRGSQEVIEKINRIKTEHMNYFEGSGPLNNSFYGNESVINTPVYYLAKNQDFTKGGLNVKVINGSDTEKIEKLKTIMTDRRAIFLELGVHGEVNVKVQERFAAMIGSHQFTHMAIRDQSGREQINRIGQIQVMTRGEAIQLNNAINQLINALIKSRDSQKDVKEDTGGLTVQTSKNERNAEYPTARPLKPSDYLVEVKANAALQFIAQTSRENREKVEKREKEKTEEHASVLRDVVREGVKKEGVIKEAIKYDNTHL